jgi:hypothetical protein
MNEKQRYAFPEVKPLPRYRICELLDYANDYERFTEDTPNIEDHRRDSIRALKELILLRDVCGTAIDAATCVPYESNSQE